MEDSAISTSSSELVLKGELIIQRVADLKEELQAALEKVDALIINLMEIEDIDLSGLQLLCAARHSAAATNKKLRLVAGSEILEQTLKLAGFRKNEACEKGCGETCLWEV